MECIVLVAPTPIVYWPYGTRVSVRLCPCGPRGRNADHRAVALIVLPAFVVQLIAFMLTTALLKRALALVLLVAVPRFLVSGIAELTGVQAVAQAAAVLGFLLTAVAMYTAFARCSRTPGAVRCCRSGASARPATPPTTTWPSSCATSNGRQASAAPCSQPRGNQPRDDQPTNEN